MSGIRPNDIILYLTNPNNCRGRELQGNNLGIMLFLVFLLVWMVYPFIVMSLRPNIFKLNKNWEYSAYTPNFFWLYSFTTGFCTTLGSLIISGLTSGYIADLGVVISILLGVISETIILLPDKLEKIFKVNLKHGEGINLMTKFVKYYTTSFLAIMVLIRFLFHL